MKHEVLAGGAVGKIEIERNQVRYERDDAPPFEAEYELRPLEPGSYSVRLNGRSFRVMLGPKDEVCVNGRSLRIEVFDPRNLRATSRSSAQHGRQEVSAPMPGKIVRVLVAKGEAVEEGQGVVVVEAMKMQNEMKSPKAGTVAEIRTKQDATVSAGDVLVVIE